MLLPPRGRTAHGRSEPGASGARGCGSHSALPSLRLFPSPSKRTQGFVASKNNGVSSSTPCSLGDFSPDIQPALRLSFPLYRMGVRRAQWLSWGTQNTDLGERALRPLAQIAQRETRGSPLPDKEKTKSGDKIR